MNDTKTCSKCSGNFSVSEFPVNLKGKYGVHSQCKLCKNSAGRNHSKKYIQKTKDRHKRYYERNKEGIIERTTNYNKEHKELRAKIHRKHRQNNREKYRRYYKNKRNVDVNYHLQVIQKNRFYYWFKKKGVVRQSKINVGCTWAELKTYLESKFKVGMSWENWGKGEGKWNIDHIIPLAKFDPRNDQHVVLAWFYLNLQPLWEKENIAKGAKIFFSR